jgi:hypothetical protein
MISWDDIRAGLNDPSKARETMIMFMSEAKGINDFVRATLFVFLNSMNAAQIAGLSVVLSEASVYIQNNDIDGLILFLQSKNIPPQIIDIVKSYGNKHKEQ